MTRPFRFGLQAYNATSPQEWRDKAKKAEDLGYSAFHLADHYIGHGPQLAKTNHPMQGVASIPAMTVAAEATSTIKIGCRVFCVDYHVPAVLVKNAMTIDWFSGGRLEFGSAPAGSPASTKRWACRSIRLACASAGWRRWSPRLAR